MEDIKRENKQWTFIFGITIALTMTIFFMLYLLNNEYTVKDEQAIQGSLCLNQETAYKKLHYLSREWQYFPGHLLTPELLKKNSSYYSRYVYIGEYQQMEPGKKDLNYSCGTYRMVVLLPKKEQTWAISVMEVFSAYRIYINGELTGEVGNPDEKNYKARCMNRVYTFQGSGAVEIVIAAADKNHIRSGLSYIPVLGSPVRINMQRGVRVLGSGFAVAVCVCIWVITLLVHIRTHSGEFGIFMLVCFCVMIYSAYPLIRSFFLLPSWPWRVMEEMSYYLILSCMIWLESRIMEKRSGKYLAVFIAAWILVVFILEAIGENFSMPVTLSCVEWINIVVRWCAAVYMLVNTFGEMDYNYGKLILIGTTVYACSLAADRIWALYEPVTGGWFPEIGGLILAFSLGCVMWIDLSEAYKVRLTYEVYSKQTELRLLAQKEHYEKLKAQMEETSRIRHDMRQHLRVLSALLERGQYREMQEYLSRYTQEFQEKLTYRSYCKNQVTDAILHYYEEVCHLKNISFVCQVEAPEETGILDTDFCRLFGNLLENAVEAAEACPESSDKFVHIHIRANHNKLLIKTENSCDRPLRKNINGISSRKHPGQGIGTRSISQIAAKYGGLADFQEENGVFKAEIFLCLTKKDTAGKLYG